MAKTKRYEYDLFTRQFEMVKTEPAESKPSINKNRTAEIKNQIIDRQRERNARRFDRY